MLEGKEIVLKAQQIQIQDLEKQLDEVNAELTVQRDLAHQVRALTRVENELRARERSLEGDLSQLQVCWHLGAWVSADSGESKCHAKLRWGFTVNATEETRRDGRV